MKFHSVHGTSITLSENKCAAARADTNFCNGIVFGDQPVKVGQKVCIELTCSLQWSGALRIGFTSSDPGKLGNKELPKYALPYLAKKEGFWIRPVNEALTADGVKLTFYINSQGYVQFFVNNEHKGALLANLPTDKSLWILFDLYGNTKAIQFVKPDDAPKEIMARGQDAVQAYESACKTGVRPVYRTRLMLVGQERVGKTSLKKALTGQQLNHSTMGTDSIDLSLSCSFTVGQQGRWTSVVTGQEETNDSQAEENQQGILGGEEGLEEEYHQALATNIVQELLYQKRRKTSSTNKPRTAGATKEPPKGLKKNKPSSASNISQPPKFSEISSEIVNEMPQRVVELVQQMLDQKADSKSADGKSHDSVSMTTRPPDGCRVMLNVWDFAGHSVHYTTHQVFLTSRAVYLLVFNLLSDLRPTSNQKHQESSSDDELSPLDAMEFWMRSVYSHASQNMKNSVDNMILSPPIVIVGTHRNSLHSDPDVQATMVEEKFSQIRDFVSGKPYVQHLVTPFFAVDTALESGALMEELQQKIEDVCCLEPYMGEQMPIQWIQFEQEISVLAANGTNYASFNQIKEIAANLEINNLSEVITMLEFYHDLGVVIFYGRGEGVADTLLANTVILKPQWLVNMIGHVMSPQEYSRQSSKWNLIEDKWTRLKEFGVLEESLLDSLWQGDLDQKPVLIGLMEMFDLICQRLPLPSEIGDRQRNRTFYIPSRLPRSQDQDKQSKPGQNEVSFYIDFSGFLPDGLFHRIVTHTIRWVQECSGQNPHSMFHHYTRFYLNEEHDFILQKCSLVLHKIKVTVVHMADMDERENKEEDQHLYTPDPEACAKVRNFLESCLLEIRELWMKRLCYNFCVVCPCGRTCEVHGNSDCLQEKCLHFLSLDECLSNKVVCCEHRRVRTSSIKKTFPEPLTLGFTGPVLPVVSLDETLGNIEKHCPTLPRWVKSVAKLLNVGEKGKDWQALAQELGYKQNKLNKFNDDLNPGLALLADWILSSGNTGLSVDMLAVYLEKMERDDILEIIHKAQESEQEPAQIFVSYQWDCQDEVKFIRDKLERSGFTCWMDIGQMGGGDQLYSRIDEGIRNSKVVLACVTPKYVVSHHCVRELSLADLLCKPILPVLVETVPWPPPGALALILSQLIYINMKGVGGHGGTGIHADRNDKFNEIIQRVSLYAIPDLTRCTDTETDGEEKKGPLIDLETSSNTVYSIEENQLSRQSSFSVIGRPTGQEPAAQQEPVTRRSPRAVEQVNVERCRVCVLL